MKTALIVLLIGLTQIKTAFAWGLKELGEEVSTPVTTSARNVLIVGTAVTLTVLILEDQIIDVVQEETVEHKPLGGWSKYGDLAGQMLPNGLYVLGQGIAGVSGNGKGYQRALGMFKATAYAASVTTVLKYTIREPRPNNPQEKNSFPSGHTTTAFAFSGYVFAEHGWLWGIPAMGISLLSGFSRINDNRHFLHDVLAGATIGFAYGVGISKFQNSDQKLSFMIVPIYDQNLRGLAFQNDF
jgi:hypothetical protein